NDMAAHSKRKELLDLNKFKVDQELSCFSNLLTLKNAIESWVEKYIVTATEDGTIFFINALQENQMVPGGEELFYIQSKSLSYYGEMMLGQAGLGKVREGQRVILKVSSYPSEEYGYLEGMVKSIADLPNRRD